MSWLIEAVLGLILAPINFVSSWADELRHRRDDDPTTRKVRRMKRVGTRCLLGAIVWMWVLLVVSALPASGGPSGQGAAHVLQMAALVTSGLAAVLLSAALLYFYRAWRLETV